MDDQALPRPKARAAIRQQFLIAAICFFLSVYAVNRVLAPHKTVLGATVDVIELDSGFTMKARVDTGASVSSLHCKNIVINEEANEPEQNSGKNARFQLEGKDGETHWIESTILGYAGIRNASGTAGRYRVRLRLSCRDIEKDVIVSLNDRSEMKYPLLLGRNFLEDDFVVDVSLDNPDFR
jgi:hypothetical protein